MKYILVLLLGLSSIANANTIFKAKCSSCHGTSGEGIAGFSPKLAGQHWQYLRDQINDIKSKKRTNGISSTMIPLFKELSDKEIVELSKYLGSLK